MPIAYARLSCSVPQRSKLQHISDIWKCKPGSIRSPVELVRWSADWQTFRRVLAGLWSWIRQHTCHHCEHTSSCIPPSSSCWWRPWVTEKWHIAPHRSLTWPAWISPCHKWTRLSLILRWPAECWPTRNSARNRASLLEWFPLTLVNLWTSEHCDCLLSYDAVKRGGCRYDAVTRASAHNTVATVVWHVVGFHCSLECCSMRESKQGEQPPRVEMAPLKRDRASSRSQKAVTA